MAAVQGGPGRAVDLRPVPLGGRRHIVPLIGAVRLRDLDAEVVDVWLVALCCPAGGGKPRLGATSARLVRKVLSMALEEAVQRGRLPRNPVPLTQPPRRARSDRQLGWTIEQARTFLSAIADHRLYAAFHLCLVAGLRRGEVLALRWSDVDLDRCQLEVRQQLAVEGGRPLLKQLKTEASQRVVTFGPSTAEVLRRHLERQADEAAFVGDGWKQTGLVFTTAVGGWIDPNNFSRLMDELTPGPAFPASRPRACATRRSRSAGSWSATTRSCRSASATPTSSVTLEHLHPHRVRAAPGGRRTAGPGLRPAGLVSRCADDGSVRPMTAWWSYAAGVSTQRGSGLTPSGPFVGSVSMASLSWPRPREADLD